MENNKLVDPFVITSGGNHKQQNPEQKYYLLLINWYPDQDSEDNEFIQEWAFFKGRSSIREFIIKNIKDFDPKISFVLVNGSSLELNPEKIPSVYQLFTDPRSSWNDPNIFPDGFNIDQEMYSDGFGSYDPDWDQMPGPSMTSAENTAMTMAAEGIDITSKKEEMKDE